MPEQIEVVKEFVVIREGFFILCVFFRVQLSFDSEETSPLPPLSYIPTYNNYQLPLLVYFGAGARNRVQCY